MRPYANQYIDVLRSCYQTYKFRTENGVLVPRKFVYWFAPPGMSPAPHTTFGSENYEGRSGDGQQLVEGSSVPNTRTVWLDGSYRAAASECQGPWLSGRSRWWTDAVCPDHRGAYPDTFRVRLRGEISPFHGGGAQETPWMIATRGPDPNNWIAEGLAVGTGGQQRVRCFFSCPAGPSLGCDYSSSAVVLESYGTPRPDLAWFVNFVWSPPRQGLQTVNATGTVGTNYFMDLDFSPYGSNHG